MSALSSFLLALLQLGVIVIGRNTMANFIAQVRMAWKSYKDEEFVALCDAQYNSMLDGWDKYKSDRED